MKMETLRNYLKNKLNVFKRGRKSHKKLLKITYTFSDLEKRKGEYLRKLEE